MKQLRKYFTLLIVSCLMLGALGIKSALAVEITAIDFNGDLIGKVIPNGQVVSYDNQLIGNVTADSLIVDFNGKLIGGVVPQGIAVGNDNKVLGKVNNDGSVRVASGKIIGKVLPNGLVIDDYFNVIGAVLFPGLVYSDDGRTVGRLTGDGAYTNLQGQNVGFITPDGYAYRRNGSEYTLEGRLISSKMIISPEGKFIGSIVPGGQITDFDGNNIGFIHANGFAYNESSEVIGRLVRSGYAFDNFGNYLGIVTYNGEVVNDKSEVIGHLLIDGRIADLEGKPAGFALDISATVTDRNGKYAGRIMPEGKIALAREVIGRVGAAAVAVDNEGNVIGDIVFTGPVFDYKGRIVSHALKNGAIVSFEGNSLGYISRDNAFDTTGSLVGKVMSYSHAVNSKNQPLGVSGITGTVWDKEEKKTVSPFGYVFNADGSIGGSLINGSAIYGANGGAAGVINANGILYNGETPLKAALTQSGLVLSENNNILSGTVDASAVQTFAGNPLGNIISENFVLGKDMKILAKILPDYSVVPASSGNTAELSPKVGQGIKGDLAVNTFGQLLGYIGADGSVRDIHGGRIGKAASGFNVLDNNGSFIGGQLPFRSIVDFECQPLGVITSRGEIRNTRNVKFGWQLLNGQAYAENGSLIGYAVPEGGVVDYAGKVIGTVSADGHILNAKGEDLGCLDYRGRLLDSNGNIAGALIEYVPVMNFNSTLIGRVIVDGRVVNGNNQFIGAVQPDGSVISETASLVGQVFKYKFAFDNRNNFLGRINDSGEIISDSGNVMGSVDKDGYAVKDNQKIGYALYDLYIYDNDYKTIGVIGKDGNVLSLNGQKMGNMDRGFMVDKNSKVLARGNRDFYIRDESNQVLGELKLNGDVVNRENKVIGRLGSDGNIFNTDGTLIGVAKPLQYYNVTIDREKIYDADGNVVGYLANDGNVYDENGRLIGKLGEDGVVRGEDGSIIGGLGSDWYERVELKKPDENLPQVGIYGNEEELKNKDFRKSLNIALTPDGEYLGDILEDGRVVDKNGKYIGRRMPDGLIIDDDGTLIGIEETQKPQGGGMFVPPGTFGSGGAYGIGAGPGGNLGPGGGFGPGERYDPQRAAALAAAQNERRQNMGVGHIASNSRKESFDGYQKNWDNEGINKSISSWRVDLSEMIFADKPIPAVIARSIDSNNPTPITAYVERNVYAEEGRNIIIPAGSRLMGTLNSMVATTESTSQSAKVQISWERLIRPDGVLFTFQGITADAMGRGGALGYLDQQLFKKYTLPILTTAFTSYTSYMMAPNENSENEVETPKQQAANDARQNFLTQMNEVFSQILSDKSNIKPLTYVPAGTRIIVFPNVDLWLRTPERDDEDSTGGKRNLLVDDKEVHSQINDEQAKKNTSTPVSKGGGGVETTGGQVLYQSSATDAEAASPKLIDDATISNQQRAQQAAKAQQAAINGAVPPPPPSTTASAPVLVAPPTTSARASNTSSGSSGAGSSSVKSDNSVPQLF